MPTSPERPSLRPAASEPGGILVTGASGFIGASVVERLLARGFRRIRCLVRETSNRARLERVLQGAGGPDVEIICGNLLSAADCRAAADGASVIYHLAAGTGTKSFSEAFRHSVVSTRNLLDASLRSGGLRRFVNVSSFAVYTNIGNPRWRLLDERCPVERHPESRAEAYGYGKMRQDELVMDYGRRHGVPYVIVRPGSVYGPGRCMIPGRVGIDTFGFFLHLGGPNPIPLTYVENCAEAVVLAGLAPGVEGEVFNIVDDDLPSSRKFLRFYKKNVQPFPSVYLPHGLSYLLCFFWERLSRWSKGELPAVFTPREWSATWKRTHYSNAKAKALLGWSPAVPTEEGLRRFLESCRDQVRRRPAG
jgi:nucleoside-diphosphate-sugar epimerase